MNSSPCSLRTNNTPGNLHTNLECAKKPVNSDTIRLKCCLPIAHLPRGQGVRAVAAIRVDEAKMILWEATLITERGLTAPIATIVVTQDIAHENAPILTCLRPAGQILGIAVRIRARTRAVESAGTLRTQARHGGRLRGSLPEVRQAVLQRKATCGVVAMTSNTVAVEDLL